MGEGRSPHGATQHNMLNDDQKSDSEPFVSSHEVHQTADNCQNQQEC
jgi:hypothetical protein